MTDLTSLSDDELTALYTGHQQPPGSPPDLSKMSDDELKAAYAASTKPQQTDTSIGGAITHGAASLLQGYGKTIKDYISTDAGKAVLDAEAAKTDPKYKSATEGFMRPEDGADKHVLGVDWSKFPRMLVEQAPGLATDLAVQAIVPKGLGPIGKYAANALTFGGRTAGAEAERRAAERTGDPNAEPSAADKLVGLGATAAQTALNQHGLNKIVSPSKVTAVGLEGVKQAAGNVVKGAIAEGGTSAAQNLISQGAAKAGTSGLDTIDPHEVIANAAAGGALGGAFSAPKGVREAAIATRLRNATDEHSVMAANRIAENGSVDTAKKDIRTELSRAASEVTNPSPETDNALVRAKAGDTLSSKDLAAVDKAGSEQLSSLVRQASALSKMSDEPGGLSGKAERFVKNHPIWTLGGVLSPHALATVGFPALGASLPAAGTLLAGAGGAYAGLRTIDSLLGLRNQGATFAERIGDGTGKVRPDPTPSAMSQQGTSVPSVTPQNAFMTPQPWGPIAPKPTPFKPDVLEPGLRKIVEKIQGEKQKQVDRGARELQQQERDQQRQADREARGLRQQTLDQQRQADREAREARQRAIDEQRQADRNSRALKEQAKEKQRQDALEAKALKEKAAVEKLLRAEQLKVAGVRRAEALAARSPLVQRVGGLDAVRNPAVGRRVNEILSTANALRKLTRQRREAEEAQQGAPTPETPVAPTPSSPLNPGVAEPKAVNTQGATPQSPEAGASIVQQALEAMRAQRAREQAKAQEDFVLPESPYWHLEPAEASQHILADALAGGKPIRSPEGYRAATQRRLTGEDAIWHAIDATLPTYPERKAFAKYFKAMRGADSPPVMEQVREAMLAEFPQHAEAINKHLTDEKIKSLWPAPKKKKK